MRLDPEVEYLLQIFPMYRSMDSEGYIVSKLLYFDSKFISCKKCGVIYIPVVNCTTRYDNNKFTIACSKCKTVSYFEEDVTVDDESFEFENVLIEGDESSF